MLASGNSRKRTLRGNSLHPDVRWPWEFAERRFALATKRSVESLEIRDRISN